jgi:hypothetical protein
MHVARKTVFNESCQIIDGKRACEASIGGIGPREATAAEEASAARPLFTRWGWSGAGKYRQAVKQLATEAAEPITHESVGGIIPTQSEAIEMIEAGGGKVQRIEMHEPGGVSNHTYPHINYVTQGGTKATVQIEKIEL